MTTSTYPATGGFTDNTTADKFIPELWSDEIIAAYEKNLKMRPLVRAMSMVGKKGDTIHIPTPSRGTANAKTENAAVTVQNETATHTDVVIDKHYEYSKVIEDITKIQALDSMRRFYTEDAGYALAKQVDDDLFTLGKSCGDGDGTDWTHSNVVYNDAAADGTLTAYAIDTVVPADVLTDVFFRKLIQAADDADLPMDERSFVVPPSLRNTFMGIERYVSTDFVSGVKVPNGLIGNLYGINIYVSTNVPVIETIADNAVSTVDTRGAAFFHKDAYVLAEQMGVRSQTQNKLEFLGDLFVSDTVYGTAVTRAASAWVVAVPD